jgi:O-antigen/teichoic acid export membrane protein
MVRERHAPTVRSRCTGHSMVSAMYGDRSRPQGPSQADDFTTRHAVSSFGRLLGSIGGRASQIMAHAVLARALGVEGFGLYALGWTILQFSQSVGQLGLSDGVVRFISRHRGFDHGQVKDLLERSLALSLIAGLALAGVAFFGANALASQLFAKPELAGVLRAFSPAIAVAPLLVVAAGTTRATFEMRHSVLTLDAGLPAMILIAVCILSLLGAATTGMALATSAMFLLVTVVALCQVGWLYRTEIKADRCAQNEREPLVSFSLAALSTGISMLLLLWSDRLFIGAFRPAAEVGAYHAASQLSVLTVIVYQPLASTLAPLAAAAAWRTDPTVVRQSFENVCRWGLYLATPLLILAFTLTSHILAFVYGAPFAVAAPAARILILGQAAWLVGGVAGAVLVMTGHHRLWLVCSTAAVILNLILNALLVPVFGMLGAAAATAVCQIGLYGGGCFLVRARLGLWPLARGGAVAVLASGVTLVLGLSLSSVIGNSSLWMHFGVACGAIAVFYAVIIASRSYAGDIPILRRVWEMPGEGATAGTDPANRPEGR